MRWMLVVTTALLLAPATLAEPVATGSWFRWWPFAKASAKKPEQTPSKTEKVPSNPEVPAALRAREKADYLRRLAVCDRLQIIATQSGDNELARKAEQLEHRAWEVYRQRTTNASAGDLSVDHQVLDRHLGIDARLPMRPLDASTSRGLGQNRTPRREVER
jgi:hypothetical protein